MWRAFLAARIPPPQRMPRFDWSAIVFQARHVELNGAVLRFFSKAKFRGQIILTGTEVAVDKVTITISRSGRKPAIGIFKAETAEVREHAFLTPRSGFWQPSPVAKLAYPSPPAHSTAWCALSIDFRSAVGPGMGNCSSFCCRAE